MFPLLLLFGAIFGAVALSSQDHHPPAQPPHAPQLALPPPVRPPVVATAAVAPPPPQSNAIPRPIEVLCEILRAGGTPPPFVVQHAIAEARAIGRHDLANDLLQTFVPPDLHATQGGVPDLMTATDTSAAHAPEHPTTQPVSAATADEAGAPASPVAAVQVVDAPSPIQGVPDAAWSHFCTQLVRESPLYESPKFAGRYRHRKDRLAEIGFDPDMVAGSPDVQDAAIAADMSDAHRQLVNSGVAHQHIGRTIAIPGADFQTHGLPQVTLSGLLGVASVAGVEGCAKWLKSSADRAKFPNTTAAFLKTNGVF